MDPEIPFSLLESNETAKKKPKRLLIIAFGLLVFVGLIYVSGEWLNAKAVTRIAVSGAKLSKVKDILSLANDSLILGKTRKQIDISALKKRVGEHPLVDKVIVSFKGVNSLKIEVVERKPAAFVLKGDGSLAGMDSTGKIIPYVNSSKSMIVVTGLGDNELAAKRAARLVMALKADKFDKKISEIHFNSRTWEFRLITLDEGYVFDLGKLSRFDNSLAEKLFKVKSWLAADKALYAPESITHIDARWKNQLILNRNRI